MDFKGKWRAWKKEREIAARARLKEERRQKLYGSYEYRAITRRYIHEESDCYGWRYNSTEDIRKCQKKLAEQKKREIAALKMRMFGTTEL